MAQTHDTDVLIAGGGLNGLAAALALASGGGRVVLVDPSRDAAADGRSYALALGSQRVLAALGLWRDLAGAAQPIRRIGVADGRVGEAPSPLTLTFDHAELEEGPMGYMVEDRHLRPALLAAVAAAGGIERRTASVTGQMPVPGGVSATLSDGTEVRARLLVGCDGKASPTAERAGIRRVGRRYGQTALVAVIGHEADHEGVAHQLFLPEGPLALLPLTGRRVSIVWTQPAHGAAALSKADDAGYIAALRPRFGDFLGDIRLDGPRFAYPLELSLAASMTAHRTALIGDAAHVVHPLAGQGLNAGLRDVAALAEVVTDAARRGEDVGEAAVLDRYAAWRRADITGLALATDGFNTLFSNDNPVKRLVRDAGLGLVQRLPDLRRGFMREAAGLTGDLPRLQRGRPL